MYKSFLLSGFLVGALFAGTTRADSTFSDMNTNADAAKKTAVTDGWQGSLAFGTMETSGNTDTSSSNAKALFGYKGGNWQDSLLFQALRASSAGVLTAESYNANGQTDYNFTDKDYVFGNLDYLRDVFSGYDRRTSEVGGLGHRLLTSDTQQLDMQFGVGARQTRYTDDTSKSEAVELLSGTYLLKFGSNSTFSENLSVEHGVSNTYSQSVTGLTTNISGSFALAITYTISHNSSVLPGFKDTDRSTAVSLVYSFPPPAPPAAPPAPPPCTCSAPPAVTAAAPAAATASPPP
ncbi:MAG TPA: DUF481 domain-containing protein [Gammaproteobacteria bacterium]|jgi:putative salt-induced outer membrane protein|nr:DUF481 domain-containing protein [Gammaproteobacteria bacterium]